MTHIVRNTTRLLRVVIVFRLVLVAFAALRFLADSGPLSVAPGPGPPIHIVVLLPALLTTLFLLLPWLERALGRFYLPTALVLTIVDFSLQYGIAYLSPEGLGYVTVLLPTGQAFSMFWASLELVLLILLPCMLAGAAYGLRSAVLASSLATAMHLAMGVFVWVSGAPPEGFVVLLPMRVGVLYGFPMIAGSMADAWRREHAELEEANQQLRGYAAAIEHLATSHERVRLARAMHDTLAHSLSALTVQLEALATLQESDPEASRAQLDKIRELARSGLDEARRAIFDLRSAPVEEYGLAGAIERLLTQSGERSGIRTDWVLVGDAFALLPVQANALYRIALEALENIELHAGATHVGIELRYGDGVTLSIQDDGRGFDPEAVDPDRYGLVGIRERAALIDGQVSVDTGPDRGTTVTVEIVEPWRA